MNLLKRLRLDTFLLAIVTSAVIATLLPARGVAVPLFDHGTTALIALLFFLYGARLHPEQAIAGLKHWRLHSVILGFTFVLFPLLGLAIHAIAPTFTTPALAMGLLYLTLVPSTVQSSINFTSVAGGNVAGAVVAASASNLIGVVLTPALVLLLMGAGGLHIDPSSILDIVLQILVPFVVGQLSRRWTAGFVDRNKKALKFVDQGVIVLVVYNAFSAGRREHIWSQVSVVDLLAVLFVSLVVLAGMLSLTWYSSGWMKFSRPDRIAIMMCGTKKSLASGLPMATVLFAGTQTPASLIVLPLMVFHQAQLMACGAIAGRLARAHVAAGTVSPDPARPDAARPDGAGSADPAAAR
ncbi:bile acid:sodium symporter family protein [Aestuariimicrobium kwangyangense]|uniref:bile acid:sodium symporter family protein n=1 Tax=Aestuariimicrobium kwangyangense TaxID=396389 RepID=UPI0003B5E87E